ncbi:MAG: hypothetical protein LIO46_06370, partial [Clostridiales bacterium]|nr:hypothetical protein [Clostridiales bacterium]
MKKTPLNYRVIIILGGWIIETIIVLACRQILGYDLETALFLIGGIAAIWAFAGYFLSNRLEKTSLEASLKRSPEINTPAKVILKTAGTQSQNALNYTGLEIVQIHTVTFELPDRKRLVFAVTP